MANCSPQVVHHWNCTIRISRFGPGKAPQVAQPWPWVNSDPPKRPAFLPGSAVSLPRPLHTLLQPSKSFLTLSNSKIGRGFYSLISFLQRFQMFYKASLETFALGTLLVHPAKRPRHPRHLTPGSSYGQLSAKTFVVRPQVSPTSKNFGDFGSGGKALAESCEEQTVQTSSNCSTVQVESRTGVLSFEAPWPRAWAVRCFANISSNCDAKQRQKYQGQGKGRKAKTWRAKALAGPHYESSPTLSEMFIVSVSGANQVRK